MRDYGRWRREREPVVKYLFGVGLTNREIAELTEWSEATIVADIRRWGGQGAFKARPTRKSEVFARALHRYAKFAGIRAQGKRLNQQQVQVGQALAKWLREDEILAHLRGAEEAMFHLSIPAYPLEWDSHVKLLEALMGRNFTDLRQVCQQEAEGEGSPEVSWRRALDTIASGQENPTSWEELRSMAVGRIVRWHRYGLMPEWEDQMFDLLNKFLAEVLSPSPYKTLDPHQIITLRFGLREGEAMSLGAVAKLKGTTRNQIRQIESKALRKLRQNVLTWREGQLWRYLRTA